MTMDLVSQGRAAKQRFEKATSESFAFLVDDFGYKSTPARLATHHLGFNTKTFKKNDLIVEFTAGHDRKHYFELNFFPYNLRDRKPPLDSIKYISFWNFTLRRVLKALDAQEALPKEGVIEDAAREFADLARKYASDVIAGDYSVFSPIVFTVELMYRGHQMNQRSLGVFSTVEAAEAYACKLHESQFFKDLEGIGIWGREVDAESYL